MSPNAQARWLIILAMLAFDGVGLAHYGMSVGAAGILRIGAALLLFAVIAGLYRWWRPDPRVEELGQGAAQLIAFFAVAGVCNYITTATALPLQDAAFDRADRALGFDWPSWFAWVHAHPPLPLVLKLAYVSATPQLVLLVIYLPLSGQSARLGELMWSLILSLTVILAVAMIWPSRGPYALYHMTGVDAPFLAEVPAVRDGSLRHLDLTKLEGLINFPSFHTTLGVLYMLVLRRKRWLLAGAVLLNGLMLVAVPSEGGHYLIDLVAGCAVALVAMDAARRLEAVLAARAAKPAAMPAE